jgi:sugar phosphate isomerase/epimerase
MRPEHIFAPTTTKPVALQLWTIREALATDPRAALARVRAAGFDAVELAPLPESLTADALAELLRAESLAMRSLHAELPLGNARQRVLELVERFQCRRLIWHGWPRDPRHDCPAGLRSLLEDYQRAAEWARREGLEFGLHNHWWEFEVTDGVTLLERLIRELPAEVFVQLDVYWTQVAGQDPLAWVERLGPRLRSLHLKDGPAQHGLPMTPLGSGVVDIRSLVARTVVPAGGVSPAAQNPSVDWVIELDECAGDALDAAHESLGYLRSVGF